jgi:hypothetical protein
MDFEFLKKLYFVKTEFSLKCLGKIYLSKFIISTIRGGFGYSFKKISCINKLKKCNECKFIKDCVYIRIFEPKIFNEERIKEIPRPFVFEYPPETKNVYEENEILKFNFIIFGNAIDFFPYFFLSFLNLGNEGLGSTREKFIIERINQIYPFEMNIFKNSEGNIKLPERKEIELVEGKDIETLKIKFITPLKIKYEGKLVSYPEFHIFIRAILRRISLLLKYWCGFDGKIEFDEIIEKAKEVKISECKLKWFDYERYSTRQKERIKHGGIKGEIEYKGDIKEFMPLIEIGSHIHIGKNTSFGLGKYIILNKF